MTETPPKRTPAQAAADKRRRLAAMVQKVNEASGRTVMGYADQCPYTYWLRRPSGIMQLDLDLGGGFPAGSQVKIAGPEGAGKTEILNYYYAMNQKIYGEDSCLGHVYTEAYPDLWFMRKCGVIVRIPDEMIEQRESERVERGLPKYTKEERQWFKQQIGEIIFAGGAAGEETLDIVLRMVKQNDFQIVGVDSITRISPKTELEKDLDEQSKMAAKANLKNRFFDNYHNIVTDWEHPNYTTLLMLGQARANMNVGGYGRAWKPAEDWSGRHGYQISLLVFDGENIRKGKDKETKIVGKWMKWDVEKGKGGTHDGITGSIQRMYSPPGDLLKQQIDLVESIWIPGLRYAVFRETRGGIDICRSTGEKLAEGVAGRDAVLAMIRSDQKLELVIRHEITAAAGIEGCHYR